MNLLEVPLLSCLREGGPGGHPRLGKAPVVDDARAALFLPGQVVAVSLHTGLGAAALSHLPSGTKRVGFLQPVVSGWLSCGPGAPSSLCLHPLVPCGGLANGTPLGFPGGKMQSGSRVHLGDSQRSAGPLHLTWQ